MPGTMTHLILQQRLPQALREVTGPSALVDLLEGDRCSPYTTFGSMGPDFLFFSVREYGDGLSRLVDFIIRAYDVLEPIVDFIGQIETRVEETIRDIYSALMPD